MFSVSVFSHHFVDKNLVSAQDEQGSTALRLALENRHVDSAFAILRESVDDIQSVSESDKRRALELALENKNVAEWELFSDNHLAGEQKPVEILEINIKK